MPRSFPQSRTKTLHTWRGLATTFPAQLRLLAIRFSGPLRWHGSASVQVQGGACRAHPLSSRALLSSWPKAQIRARITVCVIPLPSCRESAGRRESLIDIHLRLLQILTRAPVVRNGLRRHTTAHFRLPEHVSDRLTSKVVSH